MSDATYDAMVMTGPGVMPTLVSRPMPEPAPHEAVVRVAASSLNFHDLVNLLGLIPGPYPRSPMSDGAGTVVAVGERVRNVAVGDRVIGAFHPAWSDGRPTPGAKRAMPGDSQDGWLQQYMQFPANALIHVPSHLNDHEAATLPCAATTAWSALQVAHIRAGDVVVCPGTGGVSMVGAQLAKACGATTIVTSSSDDKLTIARELGADHTINYRQTPDWDAQVRELTAGRGADLVLDVGGPDTLATSVRATRMDGTVAIIGVLTGFGSAQLPVSDAMLNNIHLVGITVGSVAAHVDVCRAIAGAEIRPHISHVLGWDEIPEAMRIMQAGEHVGKIVVTIP